MSKLTQAAPNLITQAEHARRCGVSRVAVTKWKEAGKLVLVGDKVDHAKSYKGESWHGGAKKARQDTPAAPPPAPKKKASAGSPAAPAPPPAPTADAPELNSYAAARLKEGIARKEDFKGRREELNYLKDAGRLVEIDLARKVFFDEARKGRDAWMNFADNYSALIAAELGIEADLLREVLKKYVHKQLARLGEPRDQFVPA